MKVQLRVAKVLAAEAVPKSKKLIRLSVEVGEPEPRTILAGIAEAYQPEQLVGRTIVIVANLKPAKLMGIESNGMVLAASPEGGLPTLVSVDESLPAGAREAMLLPEARRRHSVMRSGMSAWSRRTGMRSPTSISMMPMG